MEANEKKIQWHPAFCSAMELIFAEDKPHLQFTREHVLNSKPLLVDLLVVKKPAEYQTKDSIGNIFRGHNIMEYKSPDDKLNIDTFYKVIAYACLYKASGEHVNGILAEDITVTFVRSGRPEKVISQLEDMGYRHSVYAPGIEYFDGCMFPVQFVIKLGAVSKNELKTMPKGHVLVRIAEKLHLVHR